MQSNVQYFQFHRYMVNNVASCCFTSKVLVWKELDYGSMTETEKQMLVSEVNLLRELKNPYIVRYYDRIIDRANTTIYIIMEYCKGGDLATIIARNKKEGYEHFLDCFILLLYLCCFKRFFENTLTSRQHGKHLCCDISVLYSSMI